MRATRGALVAGDLGVVVTGMSIDTRTLEVGQAFFAIRGHQMDGHAYVREAAGRGAACVVVHALPDDLPPGVAIVLVDETTRALGRLAAWHRGRFAVPVAAVTGSNGKTTTKEMMATVLGALGPVLKPEGSFNNQWGLPLTLLQLTDAHRAVALELGSNQPGEIAALAALARPTVGAVTLVAPAHTEFFGSLDGVQAEKGALVAAIPADGAVVLNADDPRVLAMRGRAQARVLTVSAAGAPADVRAVGTPAATAAGLALTIEAQGVRRTAHLRFAGPHNAANALVATGVGLALGLSLDDVARGLEAARPAKGRCIWRRVGPLRLLDDTYNANPTNVRAALAALAAAPGRRVVVLADMLELGAIAEAAHQEAGRAVAAAGAAELIGVGPLSRGTVESAREAGLAEAHHAETFEDTMAVLLKRLAPGDAVLVKGSRGMRMERVVDALVARFGPETPFEEPV